MTSADIEQQTGHQVIARAEIPARERATLRGIVRTQYKVLRSEIEARVAELTVEANRRAREKYADEDLAWGKLVTDVNKIVARAQKQVDALIEKAPIKPESSNYNRSAQVKVEYLYRPSNTKRKRLEEEFSRAISAQARRAKLQFDREEADALRYLAADEVKSEKAREFLDTIPSIQSALPSSTLAEVEARLAGITMGGGS